MTKLEKQTIILSGEKSNTDKDVKVGLPPVVVQGQSPVTFGEKKMLLNLPPPWWTPTGNSGEWRWEENAKGEMRWRWFDDIYGYEKPPIRNLCATEMPRKKSSTWKRIVHFLRNLF
tara:strand:+ start:708 stop:1055 length:348 start_codon:yes stop_codon:yes gene_type:complete